MQRAVRHRKRNRGRSEFARQLFELHFRSPGVTLVDEMLNLTHEIAIAADIEQILRYDVKN